MQPIQLRPSERLAPAMRVSLRIWVKSALALLALARNGFDLLVRIALAQTLLHADVKMMAAASSGLSIAVGLIAPLLLAAGVATRTAAVGLGIMVLSGWHGAPFEDGNLVLIALLGWYALHGAGAISIDRAIARGLAESPLPLAGPVMLALRWLTQQAAPWWLAALRIWLAATLLAANGHWPGSPAGLPAGLFGLAVPAFAAPLALACALGLAMPLGMLLLFLDLGTAMVMHGHTSLLLLPTMLIGVMAFEGAGALSVDRLARRWLESNVLFDRRPEDVPAEWPHIVVVGAGFGGIAAVDRLKALPVRITLVDRTNFHLFQPLLYQVATAALSPADVATPIRSRYAADGNVRVLLGTVTGIDAGSRKVHLAGAELDYDALVLATGASHGYFGRDDWAAYAPGLKSVEDGTAIRARVLGAFEKAEARGDPVAAARMLTFVIVGAGPTGVELAGAIAELARHGLRREYRAIDPAKARIVLVQSGPRVLPAFPSELSAQAARALGELGVEVLTDARVTQIDGCGVSLADGRRIATETVLWGAGVVASPAARWLDCAADRSGRIVVDEHCRVPGFDGVYAIGDTAASLAWDGRLVPGLAPAAKQAGEHVARHIGETLRGRAVQPFRYRHQGSLATIGRRRAVADFGKFRLGGAVAWWLWGAVHVGFLAGGRNRVAVVVNWAWAYFTLRPGIRLITDAPRATNGQMA